MYAVSTKNHWMQIDDSCLSRIHVLSILLEGFKTVSDRLFKAACELAEMVVPTIRPISDINIILPSISGCHHFSEGIGAIIGGWNSNTHPNPCRPTICGNHCGFVPCGQSSPNPAEAWRHPRIFPGVVASDREKFPRFWKVPFNSWNNDIYNSIYIYSSVENSSETSALHFYKTHPVCAA